MATEHGALAAKEVRQILFIDNLKQVLLVRGALDRNLLASLLIQEALDNGPHAREEHRRVHNKGLSHYFRVVVTADLGG